MPLGIVRTDLNDTGTSYRNGTPVTFPIAFGTVVVLPLTFGTVISLPIDYGNDVTWSPSASYFGSIIGGGSSGGGFELEDSSGVILAEDGSIIIQE
jgi:hypothetical protein